MDGSKSNLHPQKETERQNTDHMSISCVDGMMGIVEIWNYRFVGVLVCVFAKRLKDGIVSIYVMIGLKGPFGFTIFKSAI
jgi:hypothetical protein